MTQAATERPSLRQRLERERGRVWVVGHRGAMGHRPENTLASYEHALELGADWIELDVHLSRDGALIVIHDETLDRTTNGHGLVRDHTLAELKQLDAGSWFSPKYASQRIPTLGEILDWARARDTVVDIEIKNAPLYYEGIELAVVHALERAGMSDQAIVISFDHASVKRVKEVSGGRVATGVLYGCRPLDAGVPLARSAGADALLPHWAYVTAEDVARAHAEGLSVAPWASSDPDVLRSLIANGVDAIGTNHPDVLRRVIASVVDAPSVGTTSRGGRPSDMTSVAARSPKRAGL
jgi:glycerophosphoryl diester phosphodiesterase